MNIGYSFVEVYDPIDCRIKSFCKLTFPANENSILHRWDPPIKQTIHIQDCHEDDYFVENKSTSKAFLHSIQSLVSSEEIIAGLVDNNLFRRNDFRYNYAFNIYDINLRCIFEARIITCFYMTYDDQSIKDIYWDLYVDHINIHIYVSTSILKRLMNSIYVGTILSFNVNHKQHRYSTKVHDHLYMPRKSTILLTINKSTLIKQFTYSNNVLVLQKPRITSNNLVFDDIPLHIGNGIILTKQDSCFENESNQNVLKLHKKKKNRIMQCRVIIICNKKELDTVINHPLSNLHINFISISDKATKSTSDNKSIMSPYVDNIIDDEYAILLIATNTKKSEYSNKTYPQFDKKTTTLLHRIRKPNVESNNGDKHNQSYGKYYGFGIINKYKIEHGLSFSQFANYKSEDAQIKSQLIDNLREQFLIVIQRLNSVLKGHIVQSGNDQMNSLINFGRLSTLNPNFLNETERSQFMLEKCFSMWLCENARTESFHQEIDASYTLIGVPINIEKDKETTNGSYKFQFRWNSIDESNSLGIDIGLFDGMCLYYNGLGLFHRQVPCSVDYEKVTFWNLSMYHNYRLFNSISKSINRY